MTASLDDRHKAEVLDMVGVSCDGRTANVDFDVWCPRLKALVVVRCFYVLELDALLPCVDPEHAMYGRVPEATLLEVLADPRCKADARELVQAQAEQNQGRN